MCFDEIVAVWSRVYVLDFTRYFFGVVIAYMILKALSWVAQTYKIQTATADNKQRKREFFQSLSTIAVYATVALFTVKAKELGYIEVYQDVGLYGLAYSLAGFFMLMLLHDTYFYWVHRAMHHQRVFRFMHRVHHLSHTPTPWAAYSFNITEAIAMAIFMPLCLLIFPAHHVAIFAYLAFMIIRNALGHSGYEMFPKGFVNSKLGWITTNVHHDLHHQTFRYNYGLYFTWWDRICGTEHPEYHQYFDMVTHQDVESTP